MNVLEISSVIGIYQLNHNMPNNSRVCHSRSLTIMGDGTGFYSVSDSADRDSSSDISLKGNWVLQEGILNFKVYESEVSLF